MYQTRFTEKVRFNQLEEGDLFTFRKNGILTGDPDDELLRHDKCWIDSFGRERRVNAVCYGGAWFKINNKRAWVWRVPNKKKKKENKLNPIECKLTVMNYTEAWGDVYKLEKVAISVRKTEEDILEDVHNYSACTINMSKLQYETIFKPLFNEIKELNRLINSMS